MVWPTRWAAQVRGRWATRGIARWAARGRKVDNTWISPGMSRQFSNFEADEDGFEPWMYVDERITAESRPENELTWMPFPEGDDDAEREFVGEFMRSGKAHREEQARLKAMKPFLYANLRNHPDIGNDVSRRLRKEQKLPCVVFGRTKNHRRKPLPITMDTTQIFRQMRHHGDSFFVTVFRMFVKERKEPFFVKPHQFTYDQATRRILTMTFNRWSPGKKTRLNIPIQIIGERDCIGVKNGGSLLRPVKTVSCLYDGPGPLPRRFRLNVTKWNIGKRIHVKDLQLPPHTILRYPELAHKQVVLSIRK